MVAVVGVGSEVQVRWPDGVEEHWHIVPVEEADPSAGRASLATPLALSLLGRTQGETVTVRTPGGNRLALIIAVSGGRVE